MPSPSSLRELLWVVLYPTAWLWAGIVLLRRKILTRKAYRSTLPVICVGNLHSGGSGKTPLVSALVEHFADERPVVLSRGYGGTATHLGARVDTAAGDGPARYGDEPWMLAKRHGVPVYVSRKRVAGARAIERDQAGGFLILDDGFQHLALARNVNLVAINALRALDENDCIPLGELREPWSALSAADAVVLVRAEGDRGDDWKAFLTARAPEVAIFDATKLVDGLFDGEKPHTVERKGGYAAFCALARPEGFVADVTRLVKPRFVELFKDHHAYNESEIDRLASRGRQAHVDYFVTTEKDFPKVNPLGKPLSARLLTLRIRYEMSDEFWYFLANRLGFKSSGVQS